MSDRLDDAKTSSLQEPEKMTNNATEDMCCFGMVRCNNTDVLIFLADTSPIQFAVQQLERLTDWGRVWHCWFKSDILL